MRQILLVDGYNMIGAWPELRELKQDDLSLARDRLVEMLADYQAVTGLKVMIVFDAHFVAGIGRKYKNYKIDIIYTRKNETADERIEKLVRQLKRIDTQIYVATSDFVEQAVIFAGGALRKSARELRNEIIVQQQKIAQSVERVKNKAPAKKIALSDELTEIFEKWRREGR
ncbi:MAG TPA: NYN domain-containing protein [Bacilli bacterium]|nr:NYN domain-containing protein [Bacilli bacterium]